MCANAVPEFFNNNASQYRADLKPGSEQKLSFIKKNIKENSLFLDIGCGTGALADEVAKLTEIQYAVGTEVAKEMYSEESKHVELLLADGRSLPFQTNAFRIIHIDDVLHHIVGDSRRGSKKYVDNLFSELSRILKPNGYIIISERIQKSKILPDIVLLYTIFYGLKYGSKVLYPFHSHIHRTQPPICFYTVEELVDMLDKHSFRVVGRDTFKNFSTSYVIESIFMVSFSRINLYVQNGASL